CPAATTLIRGVCFDTNASGPVQEVQKAAEACAGKGGYLPDPLELLSTSNILNLGTNLEDENGREFTDTYYGNTQGSFYSTIVVNSEGLEEEPFNQPSRYICAYQLVR